MQAVASMSGGGSAVAVDQQDQQFGRTGHKEHITFAENLSQGCPE